MSRVESVHLKLRRAQQHIDALSRSIDAAAKRESYRIREYYNPARVEYTWVVEASKPFPPRWGIMLGDCVHNLRSSLDHLVYALAGYPSDNRKRNLYFPVYNVRPPEGFLKAAKDKLWGVPERPRAIIEGLQPYNRGYCPITIGPHPLAALQDLSNTDKHRALHLVWAATQHVKLRSAEMPVEAGIVDPVFEDGAVLFRARFSQPCSEVDIDPTINVVVQIEEPGTLVRVNYVSGILQWIRRFVVPALEPFVQ